MNSSHHDLAAILGGPPIRPEGPPVWPRADAAVQSALRAMVESGDWGRYHGPHVPELCRRLGEYHGVEHAIACCSGTAGIELALRGVGVHAGDEVILAAYDFKANFQNVLGLHAVPVLVDLDPVTWQLDPSRLEATMTPKTRAVIISHLHGGVVDAPRVRQIADARGIAVVEDACQNPGATLWGRRAGTWGDVGVLSFGGSKLLTAGRGGAILTSKTEIAARIKRHVHRGNDAYPLSEMQAAVLCPQIDELDALNERRRAAVTRLCSHTSEMAGLTPLQLPNVDVSSSYYKVGFKYRAADFNGLTRDQFAIAMRAEGIAFDAGFRGNHLIHASRRFRAADELAEATRADAGMLTLHHPVLLEEPAAIDQIAAAVAKVRASAEAISNGIAIPHAG